MSHVLSECEYARITADARRIIDADAASVTAFHKQRFMSLAARNWDIFYKHNAANFFKDRHWTDREFIDLQSTTTTTPDDIVHLLEIGCGSGNFIFPLLHKHPHWHFYACDFSKRAVDLVKHHPNYSSERVTAFCCDLTKDSLLDNVPAASVDIISAIFVLSALHPDTMPHAIHNIKQVLKPGGVVIFRDYAQYDHAQVRFHTTSTQSDRKFVQDNLYVRCDGTFSYFFSRPFLLDLFTSAGFQCLDSGYIHKPLVNRKENIQADRIFLQARFQLPH